MSRPTLALFALVIGLAAGYAASVLYGPAERAADTPGSAAPAAREILYWVAPMDPNYRQSEPGKSPMGMDLVPVYADGAAPDTGPGVRIDPAVVNNLGVETAAVERRVLRERIHTWAGSSSTRSASRTCTCGLRAGSTAWRSGPRASA